MNIADDNSSKEQKYNAMIKNHFSYIFVPILKRKVIIEAIEERNYNRDVIRYMLSPKRARQLRDIILEHFYVKQKSKKNITLFEPTACVGGATKFLLESSYKFRNKKISKIIAYEQIPERKQMLLNTLQDYGFDDIRYIIYGKFESVPNTYINNHRVIFFDPPWTSSEIPGREATVEDFITHHIKINDIIMEDWVKKCHELSYDMVLIRGPPNYQMDPIRHYKVRVEDLQNSGLLYIYHK